MAAIYPLESSIFILETFKICNLKDAIYILEKCDTNTIIEFDCGKRFECDGGVYNCENSGEPINIKDLANVIISSESIKIHTVQSNLFVDKVGLLSSVKVVKYIDYIKMVELMASLGYISLKDSLNVLSVSLKTFEWTKKAIDKFSKLADYDEMEVDCLGSSICRDETFTFEEIWSQII